MSILYFDIIANLFRSVMKIIVHANLFIMTLTFLYQYDKNDPYPNINIPDKNFLNALIELGVDKNGNGNISPNDFILDTSGSPNVCFTTDCN